MPGMTTRLRHFLERQGEGAIARLARATDISHSHISRVADGHKGLSLKRAMLLSQHTGIAPHELQAKVNTWKGKKATARGRGSR